MQVDNYFYSNCLIEALKHKLKDWKNVKITYIPPRYNEVFCPHFLWSDGKYDYDFGIERYLKWYERFLFKGTIRKRKLGFNQKWKERIFWRQQMIVNSKDIVLTKNQAVRWHRKMWNWIAKQYKWGCSKPVGQLKKDFLNLHGITAFDLDFCCDYVADRLCDNCPIDWKGDGNDVYCMYSFYYDIFSLTHTTEFDKQKAYELSKKIARLHKKK